MINRAALLTDLQILLKRLEADLLDRSEAAEVPNVEQTLRAEFERARKYERTAANYEDWRSDAITQAAAAWVLSCVFVRFLEDNRLIDPPRISGTTSVSSGRLSIVNGQLSMDSGQNRLQLARDEHEIYFREHPRETDRDYLLAVFDELAELPGTKDVFGEHNPIRELPNWLSGDAAGELLRFFQKINANTGDLIHDFTDHQWDTRFLGDLYQDLSEAARKKYALLQTPEFVEEFILDRTLEPAIEEFGLEGFKMIDPACGSGHFLLGAFRRIEARWEKHAPEAKCREVVQRALDSIFGIDVNPFAVAIARFRLLLAAMRTCGVMKLAKAPAFHVHLACGDSLYHGRQRQQMLGDDWTDEAHYFTSEDAPTLRQMLRDGTYHCVVANPPYITPKDRAANEAYRKLYPKTCHMKYSLAVPFMERLFRLAVQGSFHSSLVTGHSSLVTGTSANDQGQMTKDTRAAGYVGQITANSFMKREFGKKLIEEWLPQVDLTHVIDTSLAYIPAHGTPTVILFGRNRPPISTTLRAVMGIKREDNQPHDPGQGLVWSAILQQVDRPGSESEFITVVDSPREAFHKHPWSIGGGGAAELKVQIESFASTTLEKILESIGFMAITGEDDVFVVPYELCARVRLPSRPFVVGDMIRDWKVESGDAVLFLYNEDDQALTSYVPEAIPDAIRFLWAYRVPVRSRSMFGKTVEQHGFRWYEYMQFIRERVTAKFLIAFAFVSTHNHFVLDRGGKIFKQSAPVIKLPPQSTEDDHLGFLGLLNSSTGAFWLRQSCHDKGGGGIGGGIAAETWERFFEYTGTKLQQFPLPEGRPLELARRLDDLARELQATTPGAILTRRREGAKGDRTDDFSAFAPLRELLTAARVRYDRLRGQMISLQEELDWTCYQLYELVTGHWSLVTGSETNDQGPMTNDHSTNDPPALALGQRAFEIVMARKMAAGELKTTWFERHGSNPITDLPADWPDDYRRLVERRIELIESDRNIGLIEQPEYKRRWNTDPWESQCERALREYLLDRLESYFDFDGRMSLVTGHLSLVTGHSSLVSGEETSDKGRVTRDLPPLADIQLCTVAQLADVAARDPLFMEVGEVYRDNPAFDVQRLVAELVAAESVPLLPVLRYKPSGLRKRAQWERTWELQRREDEIDKRVTGQETNDKGPMTNDKSEIPVPPKYTSADFLSSGGARYWALRGKLDVPKERWISFPHCEGPDGTLVIAWAGYDHLQLARAISAYYVEIQEHLGGRDDPRLVPLLACVIELLPWLRQWHHDIDPDFDQRMDEFFEGFVVEEAKALNMTIDAVKKWEPTKKRKK